MLLTFPPYYPVACHTDHVGPGTTFVAIKGFKDDGSNHVPLALAKGASKIVIDAHTAVPMCGNREIEIVRVLNTRRALAELSAQAHGYPGQKLKIIGVTGTKGKSTTVYLIEHLFKTAGIKTALLSTVKNRIGDQEFPAPLTTPQPDYIHQFLALCVQASVEIVVMEVAAQALTLDRVAGIAFDAVVYTNFSQEHGEFYSTMDDYFAAKAQIIEHVKPHGVIILNANDARVSLLSGNDTRVILVGTTGRDVQFQVSQSTLAGIQLSLRYKQETIEFSCPNLVGYFNGYNIAMAVSLVRSLGSEWSVIARGLETFTGVSGRLMRINLPHNVLSFIDYAHNPSSMQAVLSTLRDFTDHLIVLFGAGGERDAAKRPLMGGIAERYADCIVLTSDNPRSEDPKVITDNILAGISERNKVIIELDREQAIRQAYALSRPGTIIVLLGKGPDEYQLVQGVKIPFSEASILRSFS